ncbi:MAG: hypothetical protein AAFX08_09580 [Pseudomonadota bacterium]
MGAISFFLVFFCLGAVVYWYVLNEELMSDGDEGLFSLNGVKGRVALAQKYVLNDRAVRRPASRLNEVMRMAGAAAKTAPQPRFTEAARAGIGSSYLVKAGGRRDLVTAAHNVDRVESAEPGELPPFVERASYRSAEGGRYRRKNGQPARSRYLRAPAIA